MNKKTDWRRRAIEGEEDAKISRQFLAVSDRRNRALAKALWDLTETYWGVEDDKNGDGRGAPPHCIQRARKLLNRPAK